MLRELFSKRRFVGLDVGASSVKAVELSGKSGKLALTGLGIEPIARDAIMDGQILDREETARAISILFHEHQLRTKHIVSAVGGNSTILKNIEVPPMSEEELRESIEWHAEEHIPFDISDVRLDYQIIASTDYSLKVLLATCKREFVQNLELTIKIAGQQAAIIDFDALALQNCYTFNYEPSNDSLVVLLHIGASRMIVHIVQGGQIKFTRDAAIGGDQYTNRMRQEMGLTFEQAEAAKFGGARDLEIEGMEINEVVEAISKHLTVEADFEKLVETITSSLEYEVTKTLDFYRATSDDNESAIQKILISGGGSKLKGLKDHLSKKLDLQIEPLDPFRRIKYNKRRFSPDYLSEIAPEMAIAVGLALRGSNAPLLAVNLSEAAAEKKRADASPIKEAKKKKKTRLETVFHFKGRNRLGELITGERIAKSSEDLRMLLRREQVLLTSFREEVPDSFPLVSGMRRKKVSLRDLESFTRRFSFLIESGAPLLWPLEALAQEQKNEYFKHVLNQIISDFGQGTTLAAAMNCHPEVFDEFYVNMIEAGETGQIIDIVLSGLLTDLEKRLNMRRSIKLAILYPLSSLVILAVVTMLSIITALHNAPGGTGESSWYLRFWARVVAATGAFLSGTGGAVVLAAVVVTSVLLGIYIRTERVRKQKDELLLRMPLLGSFLRNYSIARFARTLSTLLSSGVPILSSLDITAKNVGNSVFSEAIEKVRSGIERGQTFSEPMTEVFPPFVIQAVGIGEQIGSVDTALGKIASLYEGEVERVVSRMPLVILPLVIILFVLIAVNFVLITR